METSSATDPELLVRSKNCCNLLARRLGGGEVLECADSGYSTLSLLPLRADESADAIAQR